MKPAGNQQLFRELLVLRDRVDAVEQRILRTLDDETCALASPFLVSARELLELAAARIDPEAEL